MDMKQVIVGIVFFGVLIALGVLTMTLTEFSFFAERYDYDIYFDQANEIKVGDSVLIMGTYQGTVLEVHYLDEPIPPEAMEGEPMAPELPYTLWVRMRVRMEIPVRLRADGEILIRNSNLLGGKVVSIRLGKSPNPLPEDARLIGLAVSDPLEAFSKLVEQNKEPVTRIIQEIETITRQAAEGKGLVGKALFSEEWTRRIDTILADVESFTSGLSSEETIIGMLSKDPEAKEKLETLMDDLAVVADQLSKSESTFGKLINTSDLHDSILTITRDVEAGKGILGKILSEESEATFQSFDETVDNVKAISREIREGEGFLHQLVYDPSLGNNARNILNRGDSLLTNLDDIVREVKEGKGLLGWILRDDELLAKGKALVEKADKILDQVLQSLEDAREAAPLTSLGSFLFGAL